MRSSQPNCWVLNHYPSSRFRVDYLPMRVSWWHGVAEFGKHNHPAASENAPAPLVPLAALAPPIG
jgi:hypothetical protein